MHLKTRSEKEMIYHLQGSTKITGRSSSGGARAGACHGRNKLSMKR
jgi:hypothetical protein